MNLLHLVDRVEARAPELQLPAHQAEAEAVPEVQAVQATPGERLCSLVLCDGNAASIQGANWVQRSRRLRL